MHLKELRRTGGAIGSFQRTLRWALLLLVLMFVFHGLVSLVNMASAARINLPANTLYVRPGGGNGYQSTIGEALALANKGDVIRVAGGLYNENVFISQTVTLQGGWNFSFTIRDISQFSTTIIPADNTQSVVVISGQFSDTSIVAPTIDGFTITGGRADLGSNHGGGLAIRDSDAVILRNHIKDNIAFYLGGGIWVQRGSPLLQGNHIISNTTVGLGQDAHGGGIQLENSPASLMENVIAYNVVSGTTAHGGGLEVSGTGVGFAMLRSNTFISNTAGLKSAPGFGGAIAVRSGAVQLGDGTHFSNTATSTGGAIFVGGGFEDCCNLTGDGNLFYLNTAAKGGAIGMEGDGEDCCSFSGGDNAYRQNSATQGGAIFIGGMIDDCCEFRETKTLLRHNSADEGGALYVDAQFASLGGGSIISNTAAAHGGAVFIAAGGSFSVTNSAVIQNVALQDGGAIRNGGFISLTNSTVSGNTAGVLGGGIANFDGAYVVNATVADNTSSLGAGIMNNGFFEVKNSIIAENVGNNCDGGDLFSQFNNLEDGGTCGGMHPVNDLANTPADMGALSDYGGDTATHALMAGSEAIDAGDNTACSAVDQRGAPRPYDGDGDGTAVCDIGAFEYGAQLPWLYLPIVMK